jgi:hypothetical protein
MANYEVVANNEPDNLIAGHEVPLLTTGLVILEGQGTLERGTVLGVVSASGKGKLCDNASADGSEVAKYVLPEDVDTSGGDVTLAVWKSGIFNRNAVIFGGDDTPADHEDELRDVNIHLRDSVNY